MRNPFLVVMLSFAFISSGCVGPIVESSSIENENIVNDRINVISPTLGREVDKSANYNLLEQADNRSTLILWAGAGCSGCHDWTETIRNEMENGNFSNASHVVTIHRYPNFETHKQVFNVYGNQSSEEYTPWPILMPEEGAVVWNAETGEETDIKLIDAFDNPVTPTLQIIDKEGVIIWQSRTYWATTSVLEEISTVLNTL
tara:strand:- start:31387 stop:31989 length:603 start_codon:yes stop_codon:yes gene_type:complete